MRPVQYISVRWPQRVVLWFTAHIGVTFLIYTVSTCLLGFAFRFLLLIIWARCKQSRSGRTRIRIFGWIFIFIVVFEVISEYSEIADSGDSGGENFPIWAVVAEICVPSVFIQVIELLHNVEVDHLMELWPVIYLFEKRDIEILDAIIRVVTVANYETRLAHTVRQVPRSFKIVIVFVPVDKSRYRFNPHRKVRLSCVVTELHCLYMVIESKSCGRSSDYGSNQINISIPQLFVVMSRNWAESAQEYEEIPENSYTGFYYH